MARTKQTARKSTGGKAPRKMASKSENIGYKPEDGKKAKWSIDPEECQKILRAIQELGKGEKHISQEQKESDVEVVDGLEECELTESLEPTDSEGPCSPDRSELISTDNEIYNSGCLEDKKRRDTSGFLDVNQEIKHSYSQEVTDSTFSDIYVQEIMEDIVDHIHDDEEIYERNTKACDLDGHVRLQDAHPRENELEGATHLMEENEMEREDNKVLEEVIETQTDPIYEEIRAEESGIDTEPSSSYEPVETEKLSKIQVSNTVNENDETLEVTPEFYSCDLQDDIIVASNASIQHQEKYEEPESVQETNDFCEKHAGQTSSFDQGVPVFGETVYQMKNTFETVITEDDSTNIGETDMKVRQNQDQCLEKAESDSHLVMLVEETIPESIDICKDVKEARFVSDEEINENRSNSSSEEMLFDNEHDIEASQMPSMSEWKQSPIEEEEVKSIHRNIEESHQASKAMEEKKANDKSQKVEVDKELLKKIDEAKDREREKEKLAVERAIREARERAFADARERAALERVAAEARQKNILNGRERLKATSQATEKTPAEKAAIEAKIKSERAAVERATAEARTRALERALSEKAASDAKTKSDKSVAEKHGASRGNGTKQHSKSFSHGVRGSTEVFDGANADSAQRCKARSERHQRIGERVANALAEKSMRDRLVQKEQEERNRVAEALDADVKRWSSGKAGNLRALLSTLQYILGPDSGWQPITLTEIVTAPAVKKAYRKATLCVHPDKLQQRRDSHSSSFNFTISFFLIAIAMAFLLKPSQRNHHPQATLLFRLFTSITTSPPPPTQNDAELISKILLTHHNPYHSSESSLQLNGITLTPNLLTQTLTLLKHNSKIALSLHNFSKSLPNPPLSHSSYNLLIDIVSKVHQFDLASQLIVEMDQNNLPPTPTTFFILIKRLISANLTRQAIRAFEDIEPFTNTKLTSEHFTFLLDTLCKYGYVKLACELFNKNYNRFVPDVKMYTVLIYGWCKISRFKTALSFLNEMKVKGIEPNVVTYNVILNGMCRKASLHPEDRFERTVRDAEKVFDEMRDCGIEPDVTSFSIVLHVYSRGHKPQLVLDKLGLMKEKGICPNVVTYTSVIKCLCSCGRIEEAEDLLDEMVSSGVSPCAATYNCFFKEYRGRKDADKALKFFKKMKEDGLCQPTTHTYGVLIAMFLKADMIGVVKEIWNDMMESGVGPDLDSYTVLIHGLCERKKWREACQYFVEMIEKGFLPQKVTFETLYRGLIQSDMLRTWRRLKKRLDQESITFGSEFQNYHLKPYRR